MTILKFGRRDFLTGGFVAAAIAAEAATGIAEAQTASPENIKCGSNTMGHTLESDWRQRCFLTVSGSSAALKAPSAVPLTSAASVLTGADII